MPNLNTYTTISQTPIYYVKINPYHMWYSATVLRGDQSGRKIGVPTINLDINILPSDFKQGIYAAKIRYKDKIYAAALYFGPRLVKKETHPVLEINILDFNEEIYEESINFTIGPYIREVRNFASMEEMKKQITQDISDIKTILSH